LESKGLKIKNLEADLEILRIEKKLKRETEKLRKESEEG
jgi:hypothetical protein